MWQVIVMDYICDVIIPCVLNTFSAAVRIHCTRNTSIELPFTALCNSITRPLIFLENCLNLQKTRF